MTRVRFHLAFPVRDLQATRQFYVEQLGCRVGRESENWIDFNFLIIRLLRMSHGKLAEKWQQIL